MITLDVHYRHLKSASLYRKKLDQFSVTSPQSSKDTDRKDFHFKKIFLKLCDFQGKLDEVLGGFETFWNSEIH